METKAAFCSLIFLALLSSINAIMVSPGTNITEGNCHGPLDYFLCNCTALNTTIDIHLSSGRYYFMHQPYCLLQDKTSIKFTGYSPSDTIIECQDPFNIVFKRVRNVIISNITMVNCGNVANDLINQTIYNVTDAAANLGSGFRFAIMFYQVKDVTITEFTMQNTLGYGIFGFNVIGNVTIYKVNIKNTTFKNEPKCNGYDYGNTEASSICSGSGIFITYSNKIEIDSIHEAKTVLTIDHSNFTANRNFLPYKQLSILSDAISTGLYQTSIPLHGAASITIFYLQNTYDVNAAITNSVFHDNNGTLSATITVGSLSTIRGKTFIKHCLFYDNNRLNRSSTVVESVGSRGGISYYYLTLKNTIYGLPSVMDTKLTSTEIVAVVQCNFTKLGGTLGAAIYIKKLSTDSQSLSFRIERCNFFENEANIGSAVYAVDHRFDASLSNGLIINLINVNAENNALLPGATVAYVTGALITGVFHGETCHFKFDCNVLCNFSNNQPSVFYGHSAYLSISGKAVFVNNTARYGGGLRLINTVAFIHQDSEIYFGRNHATAKGGAIDVLFSNTNIQSQDTCPIQFTGSNPIFYLDEIEHLHVNITFKENTAKSVSTLESVYADVFYVCTWYPNTLTQITLGKSAPIMNGTRQSVYRKIFHFVPASTANDHLSILSYLSCPCDENNTYDANYCMTADHNGTLKLETPVIIGRSFSLSLITLDVVGSIGHSRYLYSEVSSLNTTSNVLTLPVNQLSRLFTTERRNCTSVDFTIYSFNSTIPEAGILHLSLSRNTDHHLHFTFDDCPVGFSLQKVDGLYACTCGEFFNKSPIKEDFQCDSVSGNIKRIDRQSWLDVINNRVEYTKLCLPEHCNNTVSDFIPTESDVLCNPHHTGRACGACVDGLSKIFGSRYCRKCSNVWLVTILLYGTLGIILVSVIHFLKLTVTMGTINGLIFFCNIMSINENLFFNTSKFSFIRLFISLLNLDLGFEMCFYREMSEVAKTGLQFVFPLYLWLLMFIIIMIGKHYIRSKKSTHSAVPVLATLIFLSYAKLLRATIGAFSVVTVLYSTEKSNFSSSEHFMAWQPDPNIKYFEGMHTVLFLVALVFIMFFIIPLTFALTFPKIVLRSKRMSYFFPLFDCVYAPYKNKYRYWFGVRLMVLIYLSGMESLLFSYQDSLLLSGVLAVLLFAFIQAYIHPFKNTINNILDLMFMVIFIALSSVILYLYPSTSGKEENITVNIFGSMAFVLFCFITIFYLHNAIMQFVWYLKFIDALKAKFNIKNIRSNWNPLHSIVASNVSPKPVNANTDDSINYAYLQESLLEEQFK